MRSAYDDEGLSNLHLLKEAWRWKKQHWIADEQWKAISESYPSPFYHPILTIRILLFVASGIALSALSGIFMLFLKNAGVHTFSVLGIIYGVTSVLVVSIFFIQRNHHYKSGVTEAILYQAALYILFGLGSLTDMNPHIMLLAGTVLFSFFAIRYLDLLSTLMAMAGLAGLLFFELYTAGGLVRQIIPFFFILLFVPVYLLTKKAKTNKENWIWKHNLVVVEAISLMLIYCAGNYLVVRELSVQLMELALAPGQDIPFSWVFYTLTVILPVGYLYFGVRNKDVVLLRVSLVLLAFSVFTFKYYYSLGHPEFTLTAAGIFLIGVSLFLFNYLKTIRGGYTRENLLAEKWGDMHLEAFVVSQTLGGNQTTTTSSEEPGGGTFGGGGASGDF